MILFTLVACSAGPVQEPSGDTGAPESELVPLEAPRLLRRLSLDLRGTLPSLEELEAVEADPSLIASYRDDYLEDERFEEQLVYLLGERWHTLSDTYDATWQDYRLEATEAYRFRRSIGSEPLRLMAYVAAQDQPWTQIVTLDHTMANEMLNEIWALSGYPEGGTGWHPAQYTDYRPGAGVLSTNGLWWKYTTTAFNQNRARAAAVSRLLLCEDLLSRPVNFEVNDELLESEDTTSMVRSTPECLACHSVIEPLSATLYGFIWLAENSVGEMETYHPEREITGPLELQVELSYWGQPINGLADLGRAISEDVRFSRCAVEGMTGTLLRRDIQMVDYELVEELHHGFLNSGMRMKALIREITDTEAYRAGSLTDAATPETADREVTVRLLSPQQLAATIEELTGFRWTEGGDDMLDSDTKGYRVLAGGVDGDSLSAPQLDPGLTWALIVKRLAESASDVWRSSTADGGLSTTSILTQIDLSRVPGQPEFDALLDTLGFQLTGVRLSLEERQDLTELWVAMDGDSESRMAWMAVLTALFRDPLFVSY